MATPAVLEPYCSGPDTHTHTKVIFPSVSQDTVSPPTHIYTHTLAPLTPLKFAHKVNQQPVISQYSCYAEEVHVAGIAVCVCVCVCVCVWERQVK